MNRMHSLPSPDKSRTTDNTILTINAKGDLLALLKPVPPLVRQSAQAHKSSLPSAIKFGSRKFHYDPPNSIIVPFDDISVTRQLHPLYVYFNPLFDPQPNNKNDIYVLIPMLCPPESPLPVFVGICIYEIIYALFPCMRMLLCLHLFPLPWLPMLVFLTYLHLLHPFPASSSLTLSILKQFNLRSSPCLCTICFFPPFP